MTHYQGRQLPHPDEPVFDQGAQFDLETLNRQLNRRGMLRFLGFGAGVGLLAACGESTGTASSTSSSSNSSASSTSTSDTTEIPEETAGPYPGDGSNGPDVLEESGVVRKDIRSSFGSSTTTAAGVPATIQLTVTDLQKDGAGFEGAAVYVWHCDREGRYSMYSEGITNENYLRGVQVADKNGVVTFQSIFPACYSGRWPHIHFEIYPTKADITDVSKKIATSQIALPKDVCETVYATDGYSASVSNLSQLSLATDNVFSDDQAAHQLATVTGSVAKGYTIALTAPVDTSTAASSGGGMGGGDGQPAPPANN